MNEKVKRLLLVTFIICIIFSIAGLVSFVIDFIAVANDLDMTSILSTIYCFFHLLIVAFGTYFAFKAVKTKSIIMRTLMYVNDGKELTKSFTAKVVALVIFGIGLLLGVFFGLSFFFKDTLIWGWNFPLAFRVTITNVGLFIASLSICFLIFPVVYDINVDIKERNAKYSKYVKSETGGYVLVEPEKEKTAFEKKVEKDEEYAEEEATVNEVEKEEINDLNALYGVDDKDEE